MSAESSEPAFNVAFLNSRTPDDEKIARMAYWGKRFHDLGMVQAAEGNMSFCTALGFIISGTGVALEALSRDTVSEVTGVVFGLDRTSVYVKGPVAPSRESLLHSAIYEQEDEVNAVFHIHDKAVLAKAGLLGIPVTAHEQRPGSLEFAQEVARSLKTSPGTRYLILEGHGTVALGATIDAAGELAEEMHSKAIAARTP